MKPRDYVTSPVHAGGRLWPVSDMKMRAKTYFRPDPAAILSSPVREGTGARTQSPDRFVRVAHISPLKRVEGMLSERLGVQNPSPIVPNIDELENMEGASIAFGEPDWAFLIGHTGSDGPNRRHR